MAAENPIENQTPKPAQETKAYLLYLDWERKYDKDDLAVSPETKEQEEPLPRLFSYIELSRFVRQLEREGTPLPTIKDTNLTLPELIVGHECGYLSNGLRSEFLADLGLKPDRVDRAFQRSPRCDADFFEAVTDLFPQATEKVKTSCATAPEQQTSLRFVLISKYLNLPPEAQQTSLMATLGAWLKEEWGEATRDFPHYNEDPIATERANCLLVKTLIHEGNLDHDQIQAIITEAFSNQYYEAQSLSDISKTLTRARIIANEENIPLLHLEAKQLMIALGINLLESRRTIENSPGKKRIKNSPINLAEQSRLVQQLTRILHHSTVDPKKFILGALSQETANNPDIGLLPPSDITTLEVLWRTAKKVLKGDSLKKVQEAIVNYLGQNRSKGLTGIFDFQTSRRWKKYLEERGYTEQAEEFKEFIIYPDLFHQRKLKKD